MELEFSNNIDLGQIATALSVLIAVISFIIKEYFESRRDLKSANREIYQKLELASIDLFRFDASSSQISGILWADDKDLPRLGSSERFAFLNYVCQILNLFEMSIRFRKEKIMPPEVFGSWVIWYYDVFSRENFIPIWKEVKLNYTCDLRRFVDKRLEILDSGETQEKQQEEFFEFVGSEVKDRKLICSILVCDQSQTIFKKCKNCPSKVKFKEKLKMPDNFSITWCNHMNEIPLLAKFFRKNVNSNYISHGEIQDGRAYDFKTWRTDIEAYISKEFMNIFDEEKNNSREFRLAVARENNDILGIAFIVMNKNISNPYAELFDLVVRKDKYDLGIGTSILKFLEEGFIKSNIKWIFLESSTKNDNAHQFFISKGYTISSKVMMKQLTTCL